MGLQFLAHLLTGLLFIGGAIWLSASDPALFFNLAGFLIVGGGCTVALLSSYPLADLKLAFRQVGVMFREPELDEAAALSELIDITRLWHRKDLLALENRLENLPNRFLQTGVQMLLARVPPADVTATLGWRIRRLKTREQAHARVFHSLATYAPAFGMLGTLIGLVNLMLAMKGGGADSIGFNWAVALVTTFYGILLSNLLFKPLATKLERRTEKRVLLMAMVLEGINLMAMGRSPAYIRESLSSFIAVYENELSHEDDTLPHPRREPFGSPAAPVPPAAAAAVRTGI